MTPTDRFVTANRLRHHLLEWGRGDSVVLLLHGFLEHAHGWDFVAPALAAAGHHVFALDWRGHGDSEWIGAGGYYHFADYSADLAFLVRALGGRAAIVGHSMGASAAVIYAGTEPERVRGLVAIDALGPPEIGPTAAPGRFVAWIADLEGIDATARIALARDDAAARLRERFPRFSDEVARHMATHGTHERAGRRAWKFDPLHQTTSPQPYSRVQAAEFWRRITCPVLYVEGGDSPFRLEPADLDDRLRILRARRVTLDGTGHHPHLEAPAALATVLVDFLAALPSTSPSA